MLEKEFYTIKRTTQGENSFLAEIELNPAHYIYKSHFPGNPITPGVCLIQIAIELLEINLNKKFRLTEAKNIKYLKVISPVDNPVIGYNVKYKQEGDLVQADISIVAGETLFTKINATYKGQ
jgi:3-hydroxyacyl-[acyl-carrier-protein] dehydratase